MSSLIDQLRKIVGALFGVRPKPLTEKQYREHFSGVATPVQRLIEAIESQLPPYAMQEGGYARMSPGQRALTEAIVYLNYHHLEKARVICAEALDDPVGPGREWVASLLEAIDVAAKLPGTSPEAREENRAAIDAALRAEWDRMDAIVARLKRT